MKSSMKTDLTWTYILLHVSIGLANEFVWECDQNPCSEGSCFGHTTSIIPQDTESCPIGYKFYKASTSVFSFENCFVLFDHVEDLKENTILLNNYTAEDKNASIDTATELSPITTSTESTTYALIHIENTHLTQTVIHNINRSCTSFKVGSNFTEAQLKCKVNDGILLSLDTEEEIMYISHFLNTFHPTFLLGIKGYWLLKLPPRDIIELEINEAKEELCTVVTFSKESQITVSQVECNETSYLTICEAKPRVRPQADRYQYMCLCPIDTGHDNCSQIEESEHSAGHTWCFNSSSPNTTIRTEHEDTVLVLDYAAFGNPYNAHSILNCNWNEENKVKCMAENTLSLMMYWCQGKESCTLNLMYLSEMNPYMCPSDTEKILDYRIQSVELPLACSGAAVYSADDRTCYSVTNKYSWWKAREECWKFGGELAHFLDLKLFPSYGETITALYKRHYNTSMWLIHENMEIEQRPVQSFVDDHNFQPGTYLHDWNSANFTDSNPKKLKFLWNISVDPDHDNEHKHGLCALPPFKTPRPTLPIMLTTETASIISTITTTEATMEEDTTTIGEDTTKKEAISTRTPIPNSGTTMTVNSCPEWNFMDYGSYMWGETQPGYTVTQPCPEEAHGTATWICGNDGRWETPYPDMSDCSTINKDEWISALNDSTSVPSEVITNLTNVVEESSVQSGDLVQLVDVLQVALKVFEEKMNLIEDSFERHEYARQYTDSSVNLADLVLKYNSKWKGIPDEEMKRNVTNLQDSVEKVGLVLGDTMSNNSLTYSKTNVEVRVDSRPSDYYQRNPITYHHSSSKIQLSTGFISDASINENITFVFTAYSNLDCIIESSPLCYNQVLQDVEQTVVNSKLLGASIGGVNMSTSSKLTINISFIHLYELSIYNTSRPSCVYWDVEQSDWSDEGCQVTNTADSHTECVCNHMTNFAVLMDVYGIIQEYETTALLITSITIIGGIMSLLCLALAIFVFTAIPKLQSENTFIHCNLCINLWLAEFILLVGLDATGNPTGCTVVAVLLHYFFLAAFTWMLLEGINIYILLVKVFASGISRVRWFYVTGYGLPSLVVVISLASTQGVGYGTKTYCWLSSETGLIWTFAAPVAAVVMINTGFLILALRISRKGLVARRTTNAEQAKGWLIGSLSLMCLLGITWVFGFMYVADGLEPIAIIFSILNSFQGAFIFGFHCLFKERNRKEIISYLRQKKVSDIRKTPPPHLVDVSWYPKKALCTRVTTRKERVVTNAQWKTSVTVISYTDSRQQAVPSNSPYYKTAYITPCRQETPVRRGLRQLIDNDMIFLSSKVQSTY